MITHTEAKYLDINLSSCQASMESACGKKIKFSSLFEFNASKSGDYTNGSEQWIL